MGLPLRRSSRIRGAAGHVATALVSRLETAARYASGGRRPVTRSCAVGRLHLGVGINNRRVRGGPQTSPSAASQPASAIPASRRTALGMRGVGGVIGEVAKRVAGGERAASAPRARRRPRSSLNSNAAAAAAAAAATGSDAPQMVPGQTKKCGAPKRSTAATTTTTATTADGGCSCAGGGAACGAHHRERDGHRRRTTVCMGTCAIGRRRSDASRECACMPPPASTTPAGAGAVAAAAVAPCVDSRTLRPQQRPHPRSRRGTVSPIEASVASPAGPSDADYRRLYKCRLDTEEHAASLPRSVKDLAHITHTAARDAYSAMRAGMPPPARLWKIVGCKFKALLQSYERSAPPFNPSEPIRTVAAKAFRAIAAVPPASHQELSDALTLVMYWCCLGHVSRCKMAGLYEREPAVPALFDARPGCGEIPPSDVNYWKQLYRLADKGGSSIVPDASLAAYVALVRRDPDEELVG
ncbi:virion protein US10 [Falconid herpesvirus 1]|uniref:Virion protein US10 n=2 Tax=Columbid alphaherpesvirus 1 TaxID=93386 RepID=A0A068ER86_9ALPH|nr:virion protein US10 [Falconid herpesvirus 1]YP_009046598.1 virion protein US10 [Falconid herpesvirus 1]YP_009352996.1 virion protein US10 [Columbid alphaherpesvirus 1]YP_009353008.1 virion protein US10 [Columbid alphaherpesvirus 1]AID52792.1 virion protein US10 [Falconid herpesvirus 1]AID52804.1 virion protein US10 [Falconid herpesvirus 1]ARD71413.1 virion protein US10 [Columbid alphaherpesvirus 1]ARD71425.1 virion protein US10 [Columbid alphaherpesvirus 1]